MQNFHDFILQQKIKEVEEPVYCRFCGRNVKEPYIDSNNNWNQNLSWEIQHQAHVECYKKHYYK